MVWMITTKLFIGLIGLILVVRLLGKKSLSDITPFDLVYTLVLGGILEESLYDDKVNVLQLLMALALWGLMIYGIEKTVQHSEKVTRWVKGEPAVLIQEGILNTRNIEAAKIEMEQLRAALRQGNCFSMKNAKHAILEAAGQLNVAAFDSEDTALSILLVEKGYIKEETLNTNQLSVAWLEEEAAKQGFDSLKEIVYGEWSREWDEPYFIGYKDTQSLLEKIDG